MAFTLSSSAFTKGGKIPSKYTADGPDLSPPLNWTDPPAGTRSFALICDDPDAPVGTWVHWVIYCIPAEARSLPEGVPVKETLPDGTKQGRNDFHRIGYGGPAPPPGKPHRYFFKLYALDFLPQLPPGLTKRELQTRMEGHVLAQAELVGIYGR